MNYLTDAALQQVLDTLHLPRWLPYRRTEGQRVWFGEDEDVAWLDTGQWKRIGSPDRVHLTVTR